MDITVIDSAAAMRRILDAPPTARTDLVRTMWEPMAGMYRFAPGDLDLAEVHRRGFGFDEQDPSGRAREGLDALVAADAWSRIGRALSDGARALRQADPALAIPDLTVLLVLGDPDDPHFVDEVQGLSAFGGISGYISVTLWPTPRVLDRLEAIAVHELHHNVRYSPGGVVWDPATVTVGEHVVAEGLADAFAAELHGDAGWTHFVADATRDDDAVLAKVVAALDRTGMHDFPAWVLGDATAERLGIASVGLPTGAGYAVGRRIVEGYLAETGTTAARSVRTPAAEILRLALPRLGPAPSA
ncbi:DUF2268 domain-containing protein [Clavibacter sp. Sh2036]|uniref:DUF2268 domain-containing protein n=1 Tax=Clavibacter sp. Sh2036 TaxID=3397677 RepID=UPI0039DFB52C